MNTSLTGAAVSCSWVVRVLAPLGNKPLTVHVFAKERTLLTKVPGKARLAGCGELLLRRQSVRESWLPGSEARLLPVPPGLCCLWAVQMLL